MLTQQNRWIIISHYLNCSGTAAIPSWNWLIITEFNLSTCRMKGSRRQRVRQSVSQNRIATCIYRTWIVKTYLTRCRERAERYWMNRESKEHCTIQTRRGLVSRILWKNTMEVLQLNRNQLRLVTDYLQNACHLKGHPFKWDWQTAPFVKGAWKKANLAFHRLGRGLAVA
jgi:hypothetical protein